MSLGVCGQARQGLARLANLPADPAAVPLEQRPLLYARGTLRMIIDDLDGARTDLEPMLPSASRGMGPHQLTALGQLADLEYRVGHWDTSAALADQLVGLVEDTEQAWFEAYARQVAVLVLAGRGEWTLAETHVKAARQALRLRSDQASRAFTDTAAVHLAYCRGDPEAVVESARDLMADGPGGSHEPGLMGWPPQYVTALVELHKLDEAETALVGMEQVALDRQHRSRLAALARVRGEYEAARRHTTEARAAFLDALRLSGGAADALETAVAHMAFGKFLRRRGERRSAVEQLLIASDLFARLGATPFLGGCAAELAACGQQPTSGLADSRHTVLTPQELAVARLVSQGRRNQEIADELVLSIKTVSYHLRNVYSKLGVRSRTELAAQWNVPKPG
jgi:DNA-binding NarL/FixJ family response regulator